jgi:hypothetical protein
MATPSNLYAEKAFSEHPIALWALDDQLDYVSLISESQREIASPSWTLVGAISEDQLSTVQSPIVNSVTNKLTSSDDTVELTSPTLFNSDNISSDLASVSFAINFLDQDGDVESVELGYTDGAIEYVSEFMVTSEDVWQNLVATFPSIAADTDVFLFIRVNLATGASGSIFFVNGISVGQWSENFASTSLGVDLQEVPSTIAIASSFGVPTPAYASENNIGYYLSQDGALISRNSSIPMVYGASNSTVIRPSTGPGLILPGKGFMNASGRSNAMTFEAWLRINSNASSSRIIGPIASTDGLYVEGPFLVLKIADNTCSHFIGEWFKPMLVDITISTTSASIMINGERVSSMDLSKASIEYADPEDVNGKSQDWIGFYASNGVFSVEVDCVGIYPYEVTEVLAKKRFVSGQGVAYPQDVNVAYSGESVFIDYSFSNYSKNYDYPEIVSWQQGIQENMNVSANRLASPTYSLPKLSSPSLELTLEKLSSDITDSIRMRPSSDWSSASSYLYFDNMNILQTPIFGLYGIFEKDVSDESDNRQVLLKVLNKTNGNYLAVYLEGSELSYVYKVSKADELVLDYDGVDATATITPGESFAAGFAIADLTSLYPQLSQFFSNRSSLSLMIMGDYVGVDESISTTFLGQLHSLGLMTNKNVQEFSSSINANGIFEIDSSNITGASYELHYTAVATVEAIDIKTKSYWDAQVPLSALSKLSYNSDGTRSNQLDFIQISLDYPQTRSLVSNELDLSEDLTSVFVTFQSISSGANTPASEFTEATQTADQILIIEPSTGWETKKYRVVDGSIIYPPTTANNDAVFNLAMCIHVEMVAPASTRSKLQNRFVRLSSQSLSDNSSLAISPINPVGTRFGKSLYPYTENAASGFPSNISFKERNPFKIFRGAAPHLFLTNNSGITVAGEYDSEVDRGLYLRLNKEASSNANISSLQMAALWNNKVFPETAQKVFEIVSGTGTFRFFVQAVTEDGKRGKLFAKLVSGGVDVDTDAVFFFLNGNPVANPVLTVDQWGMIGIVFKPYLVFNNAVGYLKITSPILLNNISTYQLTGSDQLQQIVYRTWEDVLDNEDGHWDDWYNGTTIQQTWSDMIYQVATFNPAIDPVEIYKVYIGTNKIIADSSADSGTLMYNNYQYAVYENVQRDAITATQL